MEVFSPILPPSGRLTSNFTSLMVKSPLPIFKSERIHSRLFHSTALQLQQLVSFSRA